MRKFIGFSQKIKRVWLDAFLDKLVETTDQAELRLFLDKHLKDELPGKESRAKTSAIILRIWSNKPPERLAIRDRAVALLPQISGQERIWLHWGMAALAYPFFRDTAEVVGRLLALQDDFTSSQVQGRMITAWGDRATTRKATQKIVNMLLDWEVFRPTKIRGHFLLSRKITASIPDLQLWLLESLLAASSANEIEAQQLLRLPESFPFGFTVGITEIRKHQGFDIHRQGLDMDMVAVRKIKLVASEKKQPKGKKNKAVPATLFDLYSDTLFHKNHSVEVVGPHTESVEIKEQECKKLIEDSIMQEVMVTMEDRVRREIQLREITFVYNGPFSGFSAECGKQFRDGNYLSCIILSYSVVEMIIQHAGRIINKKKSGKEVAVSKELENIYKLKVINHQLKEQLQYMMEDQISIIKMRTLRETDKNKLEEKAGFYLKILNDLTREIFRFRLSNGTAIPNNPDFWSTDN